MLRPRSLGAQSSKTRPVQFIHKCSRHEVLVLKAAKQGQFSLYTNAHATKSLCSKQQNNASSVYTQMLTPRSLGAQKQQNKASSVYTQILTPRSFGAQSSKTRPVQVIHKCSRHEVLVLKSSKTRPVQFIHKCIYTALLVEKV